MALVSWIAIGYQIPAVSLIEIIILIPISFTCVHCEESGRYILVFEKSNNSMEMFCI